MIKEISVTAARIGEIQNWLSPGYFNPFVPMTFAITSQYRERNIPAYSNKSINIPIDSCSRFRANPFIFRMKINIVRKGLYCRGKGEAKTRFTTITSGKFLYYFCGFCPVIASIMELFGKFAWNSPMSN